MADKGMPPFLKKKLGKTDEDEEEDEKDDDEEDEEGEKKVKGKSALSPSNPLAKWAQKKKG